MADVSPVGVQDFGNLMTSFGQGIANTNATNANTANTNASTGLVNQQAQGAQLSNQSQAMQNQIMQARLPKILKALGDYRPQSDDSGEPDEPSGGNGSKVQATPATDGKALPRDPTNPTAGSNGVPNQPAADPTENNIFDTNRIIAGLKQAYYVNPAGNKEDIDALRTAAAIDPEGKFGILGPAKETRQLVVDNRLAAAQSKAGELYDAMDKGVLNAPEGRALDALDAVSPGVAERIRKMLPDEMDEDKAARKYAEMIANEAHQYTGRPVEKGPDNVYRDSKTLRPLVGADRVGMTQDQIVSTARSLFTPSIQVPDGKGGTILKSPFETMRDKDPTLTPQKAITKLADMNNVPGASPTITGAPRAEFQGRVKNALDQVTKEMPAPGSLNAGGAKATAVNSAVTKDPKLADAMKDTDFDVKLPTPKAYSTPDTDTDSQLKDIAESRKNLYAESRNAVVAASTSNQYLQAARDIIDSKGVMLGKYGGLIAKAGSVLPFGTTDANNYAEVAKYLTQAALQNSKQGFGNNFTEKEFDTAMNQMNANANMSEGAVTAITNTAMRANQYALDSAKHAVVYASDPKKDPRVFQEWNQTHFPRETAVNTPAPVQYKTPQDVGAAYKAGKITRAEAEKILVEQHGIKK